MVALSRLGEDVGKGYNAAKDLDKTLQGLAISDYNLQSTLGDAGAGSGAGAAVVPVGIGR